MPLSPVRHKQNGFWLRFPGAHGGRRELRGSPWCVFYTCDAGHHSRLGVLRVASWFGMRGVQPLLSAEPPTQVGSLPGELVHHWQDCSENRISIPPVGAVVNGTPSLKPLMVLVFSGGYPSHVKRAKPRPLVPGSGVKGNHGSAGVRAERKAPNIGPKNWAGCGFAAVPFLFGGRSSLATCLKQIPERQKDRKTEIQTDIQTDR